MATEQNVQNFYSEIDKCLQTEVSELISSSDGYIDNEQSNVGKNTNIIEVVKSSSDIVKKAE